MSGATLSDLFTILDSCVPPGTPAIRDPEKPLLESGLDSLDVANFFLAVEEKYNIKFTDQDLDGLNTLTQITQFIEQRRA